MGVDAWKTGVKTTTLENCFEASQVKIHGPFLSDIDFEVDDMPEVEEEILECIRVAHPGLQLSRSALQAQFISPPTEVVEDPTSDIENAILATYLPSQANEPETEASPPPPLVTPHAALSYIEGLLLFSLQSDPTPNTTELQDALKHEKKRIELLEVERRRQNVQRRITDFLGPSGTSSSLP